MQICLDIAEKSATTIQYYLRRKYKSRKGLKNLILMAVSKEVAWEVQKELDELYKEK
jgi:hypothetical protein